MLVSGINTVIWQYMSSNHLSPHKIITVLLTIFLMQYITSPWLIFYLEVFVLIFLNPLHLFCSASHSFPSPKHQFVPCVSFCFCFGLVVHFFCFLDFTYKWDHMVLVFLWFILLSIVSLVHPCCHKWQKFPSFTSKISMNFQWVLVFCQISSLLFQICWVSLTWKGIRMCQTVGFLCLLKWSCGFWSVNLRRLCRGRPWWSGG